MNPDVQSGNREAAIFRGRARAHHCLESDACSVIAYCKGEKHASRLAPIAELLPLFLAFFANQITGVRHSKRGQSPNKSCHRTRQP